jgi:tetratricopeptide (TPR) repeat protein
MTRQVIGGGIPLRYKKDATTLIFLARFFFGLPVDTTTMAALYRPTPHSIALAALISLHCQEDSPLYATSTATETTNDFVLVDSFLQNVLLNGRTSQSWSSLHGPRVHGLLQELEEALGEQQHSTAIAKQFRAWLRIASSSIDALTDLMTTIQRAVQDGSVDAVSSNGIFLRQCSHGFNELSFESVAQLWKDFQKEVLDEDGSYEQQWTLSSEQLERAVREQCLAIPRCGDLEDMQAQLQHVLDHNPELPAAYFLRFLLCLQSGERVGAMDALHQYMDYAVMEGEDILQFAAILKAALHEEFGEHALAAAATEEAVRVAQQCHDAAAVAFALGWLAVVRHNDPELMQRCVQRAGSTNLRSLVAGANLSLAAATNSWTAHHQAVTDPAGSADAMSAYDRPTHVGHLEASAGGIAARQKLVAAGLWNHFGETTLSAQASLTALHCHGDHVSSADAAVAIHNLCTSATVGSTAAANTLLPKDNKDDDTAQSSDCIYGNAIRTFISLRDAYQLPVDGIFLVDVALVLHEWAVRRDDLEHAEAVMTVMESHLHPRVDNYNEIVLDIAAQRALLLSRQGRWDDAKSLLKDLIEQCKAAEQHDATARILLQLSMLHLESNQQQFTNALRPLLECLTLSKKHSMGAMHAAALSMLAQVHLRMGNASHAVSVLQGSLPSLLQQGHVWMQAEANLTLAKCRMKQAKDCTESQKTKRYKLLQAAVQELTRSKVLFLRCQDCRRLQETYYLLARVYDTLPDAQGLRDAAAEKFVHLSASRTKSSPVAAIMSALTTRDGLLQLADRPGPVGVTAQ